MNATAIHVTTTEAVLMTSMLTTVHVLVDSMGHTVKVSRSKNALRV